MEQTGQRNGRAIVVFILFLVLLTVSAIPETARVHAQGPTDVEFFDIKQGKVVKAKPVEPWTRKEAEQWLGTIDGPVTKAVIDPKGGLVWKVPLQPAVRVDNPWFQGSVDTVFVFLEKPDGKPFLLIFSPNGQPLLFSFKHDIAPFVKKYGVIKLFG